MNFKYSSMIMMACLAILFACNENAKTVDANIIENPSSANNPEAKGTLPVMTFTKTTFEFGNLTEGDLVEHLYHFKNTGNKALLISDVKAECGCTVPVWPREPIMPNQESDIKIQFNSSGKSENINKKVTIFANTDPVETILTFTAYVKKRPEGKY